MAQTQNLAHDHKSSSCLSSHLCGAFDHVQTFARYAFSAKKLCFTHMSLEKYLRISWSGKLELARLHDARSRCMPEDRRKRSEIREAGNLKFVMYWTLVSSPCFLCLVSLSCLSRTVSGGGNIWAPLLHVFHHYVLGAVSLPLCDKAEQSAVSITCNFTL